MGKNFIRVRSAKDIIISTLVTIAGIILFILQESTGINILGFFLILIGILLFSTLKSCYKDEETGARYCKKEIYS